MAAAAARGITPAELRYRAHVIVAEAFDRYLGALTDSERAAVANHAEEAAQHSRKADEQARRGARRGAR